MILKRCLLFICLTGCFACTSEQRETTTASQTEELPVEANIPPADTVANSQPNAQHSETFIIPGKSVGLIKLNEDAEVVQKLLGEPTTANAGMGKSLQTWELKTADGKDYTLSIFFSRNMGNEDEKSRAKQIRIMDPKFENLAKDPATEALLKTNSGAAKKTATFTLSGPEKAISIYDNLQSGIAFETDQSGNVIAITVHEPGKAAFEVFTDITQNLKRTKPSEQTTYTFSGLKN